MSEREKIITTIFTSSSLEVLLHLIQTCSHGDPHRIFKVNPIAARRCLGVRVCSRVCDCEQSRELETLCVRARAKGARPWRARGDAHPRWPRPLGGGGGGGGGGRRRRRRRKRRRKKRRGKWLSAAGGLKVTRLVQKTASRKEVTEDEWEKESRSQPLKHRVKKFDSSSKKKITSYEVGRHTSVCIYILTLVTLGHHFQMKNRPEWHHPVSKETILLHCPAFFRRVLLLERS
ncbi:uncharacterized protein [Saccopteryx leptura]|uniref:uncharacterized protein n=1 Tax=Saccopteryx leptura TaxID=249018 RepID=UPI00339C9119